MMAAAVRACPSRKAVDEAHSAAGLRLADLEPWDVPSDLADMFLYAGKDRPELCLDEGLRNGISSFREFASAEVADGLARLRADLDSARWEAIRARADQGQDPAELWRYYMQLTEIEQAFKELKHNLAIRPIFHQRQERTEAHIFVSFIAYCLLVTVKNLARPLAPGLTPRAIVEKFATIRTVELHVPTADGRHLVLARHAQPNHDHELLLRQLGLKLPNQPAPKLLS